MEPEGQADQGSGFEVRSSGRCTETRRDITIVPIVILSSIDH